MKQPELHKVEISVLRTLRRSASARFSALMKPTGLQSDSFKFYIRRLIELGYVEKDLTGNYHLTAKGKEFANNLDPTTSMIQKQPKLSVLIIIPSPNDTSKFLFQRRLRHPYYNFYGAISGPVRWGEEIEVAAKRELTKQTGLQASFEVKAFYRQKDFDKSSKVLLEDKLFAIVEATVNEETLTNSWAGGDNKWMTVEEYLQQEKRFPSTDAVLKMRDQDTFYNSEETHYLQDDY